jgi:CRP/FNR family cyclic AMP-dependent transcriptional regulator
MQRYLVVANQTLIADDLLREIGDRLKRGSCRFHIVVPATPPSEGWTWTEGEAKGLARDRLDRALIRLQKAGAQVEGHVGDADPFLAIQDTLRNQQFDEIIISTFPPRISSWLKSDLVRRVASTFKAPVTHVVAPPERATRETALMRVPLFAGLSKRRIRALARVSMAAVFREGETIIRQGSAGSELFVILDGGVNVVRGGRTVARLSPGDVFGEISLLDGGPRTADVIADLPTRCVYLSGREFRAVIEADPAIAMRILQEAGRRLRELAQSAT